jgi:hypothetical protein
VKTELSEILDSIGGKGVLVTLGCRVMLDDERNMVILSDIKTTRKCKYIRIENKKENVEISFYKTKGYSLVLVERINCPIQNARKTISDFTSLDI